MAMTEAATTPVVAASSAPTKMTAKARPPRSAPNSWPMVSSRSSAMPLRSRIRPMKVKNGMASRVALAMMPNTRCGSACNRAKSKKPDWMPITANSRPLAASEKATG